MREDGEIGALREDGDVDALREDDRAIVRSDERALLLLLLLLSLVALAVFLYYVTNLLGGLPDPIPDVPSGAGATWLSGAGAALLPATGAALLPAVARRRL